MKKSILKTILLAMSLSALFSITSLAAQWQQNETGWWWQNDDGSYPTNQWQWLDGNNDNIAECYYFDSNGYCLQNTTTPDGYTVNPDGAWTVNGVIQTQPVSIPTSNTSDESWKTKPFDQMTDEEMDKYIEWRSGGGTTGANIGTIDPEANKGMNLQG